MTLSICLYSWHEVTRIPLLHLLLHPDSPWSSLIIHKIELSSSFFWRVSTFSTSLSVYSALDKMSFCRSLDCNYVRMLKGLVNMQEQLMKNISIRLKTATMRFWSGDAVSALEMHFNEQLGEPPAWPFSAGHRAWASRKCQESLVQDVIRGCLLHQNGSDVCHWLELQWFRWP